MGIGDQLMGSGMAKGARDRGVRIAFGDRFRILWDQNSEIIFRGNPNIAAPGSERHTPNLEWIEYYKGKRGYNRQENGRWIWNYDFRPIPGEIYLTSAERRFGDTAKDCIVIEPNVPAFKSCAKNKQWPVTRYNEVAKKLLAQGHKLIQLRHRGSMHIIPGVHMLHTVNNFRLALSALRQSRLYLGAEGGLHHGAAAVGVKAVVLFGGFVPPQVTGYPDHINLTGGAEACGSLKTCDHCRQAMERISVDEVFESAMSLLCTSPA